MKRLAFLLLVVLLVAAMGVPTWAVQYRPDLLPLFQTFRDFAVYKASFYCPDYPYYAIFFNSNFTIGTFVFSKTPIISVGSIIYSFEVRESWMDSDSIGAIWSDRVVDRVEGSGSLINLYDSSGFRKYFQYYINDMSTAFLSSSLTDVFTLNYDWQVNVLTPPPADKTALTSLVNSLSEVSDIGYSPISWAAFQNALQSAISVLDSSDATQEQVDNAHADLQLAFDSLILLPDTGDFESDLEEAESIINENYTPASWGRFQSAMQAARLLLEQPSYTQEEVDAVYLELQAAIAGLTIDKPPPEESSKPDTPPPIVIGGYDVPDHVMSSVKSGNIMDMVTEFAGPFLDHAMSAFSVVIPLLGLFLATKLIPKIFRFFVR